MCKAVGRKAVGVLLASYGCRQIGCVTLQKITCRDDSCPSDIASHVMPTEPTKKNNNNLQYSLGNANTLLCWLRCLLHLLQPHYLYFHFLARGAVPFPLSSGPTETLAVMLHSYWALVPIKWPCKEQKFNTAEGGGSKLHDPYALISQHGKAPKMPPATPEDQAVSFCTHSFQPEPGSQGTAAPVQCSHTCSPASWGAWTLSSGTCGSTLPTWDLINLSAISPSELQMQNPAARDIMWIYELGFMNRSG